MPDKLLYRITKSAIWTDFQGERHEAILYVRYHTRKSDVTQILNMARDQNEHPVGTMHYTVVVESSPIPDFEQIERVG